MADESWKVIICARDAERADEALSFLSYVLTDAGSDLPSGLEKIRAMSGQEIIEGLQKFKSVAHQSVAMALKKAAA